jgi:hypothetical protein
MSNYYLCGHASFPIELTLEGKSDEAQTIDITKV